jgi:uncharacterized protein YcfJ
MNLRHVLTAGVLLPSVAFAGTTYDQARVISAQPMYEIVSVTAPREQCSEQRVQTGSGGGINPAVPLLAAVAGGVLGSAITNHHNQRAGGVVGAVFGGAVGYDVARRNAQPRYVTYGTQEVCTVVQDTHEEERVNGYRVQYQYLGQTYSTVMRNPPGDTVRVRVDVSPAF